MSVSCLVPSLAIVSIDMDDVDLDMDEPLQHDACCPRNLKSSKADAKTIRAGKE